MTNFRDHAVILARYMLEHNLIAPHGNSPTELQHALRFSDVEFRAAEHFLLQAQYVSGGGGSNSGIRWLTPAGVEYVNAELSMRIPISLDAERVLGFAVQNCSDDDDLTDDLVMQELSLTEDEYEAAVQQLLDFELVETETDIADSTELRPTRSGRQAVHRNFRETQGGPTIQAGAVFTGPVSGSNIQAIANAIGSQIQQSNITELSSQELREEINATLEELVSKLVPTLGLQERAAYTGVAAEFQTEVAKAEPDTIKLQQWLAALGFLSDFGGAIDFSGKVFRLIVQAGPYIILLGQMIDQLLKNVGH